jgi:hypothetical protein
MSEYLPITNGASHDLPVGSISIDNPAMLAQMTEGFEFELYPIRARRTDIPGFSWQVVGFDIRPKPAVPKNPKTPDLTFRQVVEHTTDIENNEVTIHHIKMVPDTQGYAEVMKAVTELKGAVIGTVHFDGIPTWADIDDENIEEINTTMEFREKEGVDPGVVDDSGRTEVGESDQLIIKDGESKIITDFGEDEVT